MSNAASQHPYDPGPNPPQLTITELHPCPHCNGEGIELTDDQPIVCRVCDGARTVNHNPNDTSIPY